MRVADWLEVVALAISALLAVWLGLTVALRSGLPARRVFTWLALLLATWSSSIIVQRLTTSPDVEAVARGVEELMAALALAGIAQFALEIATDGHPARRQQAVIATLYAILVLFAIPNVVDRGAPVAVSPPYLELGPIPGPVLGWAWVVARLAAIGIGALWLIGAMRAPDGGTLRRRQLGAALATIAMAGLGASLRFLPEIGKAERWIGTSFITLAVVCATYAVFATGIFFGSAVAARAFRASVAGGAAVGALVVALLGIELFSTNVLGLAEPYLVVLALVAVAAAYGPLGARFRGRFAGRTSRVVARDRLLRALGEPTLMAGPAAAGIGPALAHLARALDVTGVAVASTDGSVIASRGSPSPDGPGSPLPLKDGEELVGVLHVGGSVSGAPLGHRDRRLLELSAAYFAGALRTGRREDEQASELAALAEARAMVDSHAEALHAALVERREEPVGLSVFALGPMRMERGGTRIEHWGGDKAGSRQAQGLFGFLFDRGERGVAKDEVLELIWPDIDLERSDLAFHRTMAGLRATLDPDRRRGGGAAIRFANDRYRLDGSVIAWSDVDAFLATLETAAADGSARTRLLEEARRLFRGEYLDDCPYYGDSVHVEERRVLLRSRFIDLMIALGETYESDGDRMSAAAAFREALMRAPDGCPPAAAGLARLGL